ncbi:solute carrier family 23 protein [Enterococcus faecalis]|uniref:solute carrier family 23 protein n=1 Tax=Enterococcus faecalis TaxID=1351 RepID=UPI002090E3A5|nr:solute carrier family 23 protein [Enterococcus faecalis]MCO5392204.1 NCS2 family nucleobase:cation symporter [Enterococcus faecalis]MCO5456235.1 NCS2 family nucleobase:cation symporter [Enterococcus faecalis]MCO5511544.1 NCS2 family nucleobase:cation symporter [Enterococcus faecalis]MCO5517037.1 NCS2 family nucleobase:cation symporter [Enterococcus faecalis]MCO5528159.1 NCS2 family nucleobase:cation symporter [Enterococcus faecalis]
MSEKEFRNEDAVLDIKDRPQAFHWVGLSLQHLFTMFGATVLVPILVGIDPGIALVSSGLGTMVYLITTKGKIPAYLGSSFAFIAAMQMLMKSDGYPAIAQGAMTTGLVYLIVSLIIKKVGSDWLDKILPPIVVGPVVMVIGLGLAANAANNAMYNNNVYDFKYIAVALITLGLTIFYNMFFKGFLGLIPILLGIVSGYLVALAFGIIDLTPIKEAAWFALPNFEVPFVQYEPKLYLNAITTMAPIAFVTMTEHIGHLMVLNKLTKRNFFQDPGLSKTLMGDGLAQIVAGFVGGPPVTSYGENIGVLAITRVHSVFVIGGAAVFAVALGFVGKLSALILSIPGPVISGISFVLFGVIAASGLKILIDNKINFDKKKNLLIASVILVIGIGGLVFKVGTFELSSMALATVLGIVLNLILPENARSEEQ